MIGFNQVDLVQGMGSRGEEVLCIPSSSERAVSARILRVAMALGLMSRSPDICSPGISDRCSRASFASSRRLGISADFAYAVSASGLVHFRVASVAYMFFF